MGNSSKRQELLGELDALLEEVDEAIEDTEKSVLWLRCEQVLQNAGPGRISSNYAVWVRQVLQEGGLDEFALGRSGSLCPDSDCECSATPSDNLGNTLSQFFRFSELNNDLVMNPPDGIDPIVNDTMAWSGAPGIPAEKVRQFLKEEMARDDPDFRRIQDMY